MSIVNKLYWLMCLCMVSMMVGCNDSGASKDKSEDDKETDSKATDLEETETTDNGEDDEETDSKDTDSKEDGCSEFELFVDSCDYNAVMSGAFLGLCDAFDEIFIDNYLNALMSCISELGCDQLEEVWDEGDETDTDTDADADAGTNADAGTEIDTETETISYLELCMATALVATEPEADNQEFKEHFCDYAMECDSDVTQTSCDTEFTILGDLFVFMILEDKYIEEADACIYPVPDCSEAEDAMDCIEKVTEGIGDDLDDLFSED